MQSQEQKQVIDAINGLGRRVTAADVAAKTGLPLNVTTQTLNKIASDANGHLEVSTAGDIAYKFDLGFETTYIANGIARAVEVATKKILEICYFLLRISFGIMLIVSFVIIIVLIIVAVIALSKLSDRDDGGGLGGFNLDFFDYMILRDLIWWSSGPVGYGGYGYDTYDRPSIRRPQQDKGNFLFNVFSFLFGDGEPNAHLEERKWQVVAEVIRTNKGVVTSELLAPYMDIDPKNEDDVLPVLVRFDGRPEVTDTGNIVYVFPSMQVHTAASPFRGGSLPHFLNEFRWKFSNVDPEALTPVYILAAVNLFGSWWLLYESAKLMVLHTFGTLIVALTIYGTAFLLVPAIRWLILQWLNSRIEARNNLRQEYAAIVQNKPKELLSKLQEAAQYHIGERTISKANTTYTTEKDVLDQEFEPPAGSNPYVADLADLTNRFPSNQAKPGQSDANAVASPLLEQQSQSNGERVIHTKEKDAIRVEKKDKPDQ